MDCIESRAVFWSEKTHANIWVVIVCLQVSAKMSVWFLNGFIVWASLYIYISGNGFQNKVKQFCVVVVSLYRKRKVWFLIPTLSRIADHAYVLLSVIKHFIVVCCYCAKALSNSKWMKSCLLVYEMKGAKCVCLFLNTYMLMYWSVLLWKRGGQWWKMFIVIVSENGTSGGGQVKLFLFRVVSWI